MKDALILATNERRLIAFDYDDAPRLVMPHAVGHTSKGKLVFRGFQILGDSQVSRELGWKLFSADKCIDLIVTDQAFDRPADGYKMGDRQIAQILAQLEVANEP